MRGFIRVANEGLGWRKGEEGENGSIAPSVGRSFFFINEISEGGGLRGRDESFEGSSDIHRLITGPGWARRTRERAVGGRVGQEGRREGEGIP